MPTVLITGGTGLVGRALSKDLLQKGYKIIILTRRIPEMVPPENLSYALWNIKKQEVNIPALQQADFIIHLAGASVVEKKWTVAYKKEIMDSRTESSRLIINVLSNNNNKVKAIVSAGAIGWYGADTDTGKAFIETDAADDGFLGQTCKIWEESIEPVLQTGKRLVIFRTGIVLSKDGGALAAFMRPIRFGIASILGNGKQMISWIHMEDLCRLFMTAIENEHITGCYNAVAPGPVNNKSLILALARKMKMNFFIPVHVPSFFLKFMLGQRSIEVLKSCTVSCKKITDSGFEFRYNSIESALDNLIQK